LASRRGVASEPLLAEVDAVVRRPEVLRKLQITVLEARALMALLRRRVTLVTPSRRIQRCRDPDDDKSLECAVAGAAERLVTADDDLLSLGEVESVPVVDVPTFWHRLQARTIEAPEGD
jgi:putative PIN family toxin of toxin-antitoxin system